MSAKNVAEKNAKPAARARVVNAREEDRVTRAKPSVALGRFVGLDSECRAQVEIDGRENEGALAALCATDARLQVGDTLALGYIDGDAERVIILGRLQTPRTDVLEDELVLQADKQVTLRCGKASLVLTRAGKLLLRGAYVSSHSSGVNRIKGGSVQIN